MRDTVAKLFSVALVLLDVDPKLYGLHSFRVVKCTELALAGSSDANLREAGRWKTNAFQRYIRHDVIKL